MPAELPGCSTPHPALLHPTLPHPPQGPFHLGRMSIIVGTVGVIWGCFISVVLILPTVYPIIDVSANRGWWGRSAADFLTPVLAM